MEREFVEIGWKPERSALLESLFSVGNGHLGLRGAMEEPRHATFRGTLVNGVFASKPIRYGEWAYGYAKRHQSILNVADLVSIDLSVDGHPLDLSTGRLLKLERRLDLGRGQLRRVLEWEAPSAGAVRVTSARLASFERPEVAAMRYEVEALSACRVRAASLLDASVRNRASAEGDPRVGTHLDADPIQWEKLEARPGRLGAEGHVPTSGFRIAVECLHRAGIAGQGSGEAAREGETLSNVWEARLEAGDRLVIEKYVSVVSGREGSGEGGPSPGLAASVAARASAAAEAAREAGWQALVAEQEERLEAFWEVAEVEIEGGGDAAASAEGLAFSAFHLFQSAGRDGVTNLAAKGLSGEGYEGHYFWDTEIFALPFFSHVAPEVARALLMYRITRLDAARARARELSLPGALFPWRTIDGEEASAYFPAGTAQYHIDADIAWALLRYVDATGDPSILLEGGAELLFETARLWMGLGFHNPRRGGRFCIPCVTGPDEYTALVDNNAYTNLMAEANLRAAADEAERLAAEEPAYYSALAARIGLSPDESAAWRSAADLMYLPSDPGTGILPQDDQFLDRPAWDLASTPREKRPLLLHYHPLTIYSRRVLKQPDTVLALFLRHDRFSLAEKSRNFRYYEPLTTGDSSLAHSVQCVMAAECGMMDLALAHFRATARIDLDDVHGNSRDGVHIAAMAGGWMAVVNGFGGLREDASGLSFRPRLPRGWTRLAFRLRWRGRLLSCDIRSDHTRYELLDGPAMEFAHEGARISLGEGGVCEIPRPEGPRAWVFDLDGVVADTARLHLAAWSELALGLGIHLGEEAMGALKGRSRMDSLAYILGERHGDYDKDALEALAARKNARYVELLGELGPEDVLPGMSALIADLKADGIPLALASASRNAPAVLERLGLASAFDAIVDPATVAMPKPDAEIFIRAAELLGLSPDDCVGVEDAQAGVDAIKAASMFAMGVGASLRGADLVVSDTGAIDRLRVEEAFKARR